MQPVHAAAVHTTVHAAAVSTALLFEERLKTVQKGCFCVRNGSVTPREEGFTKQTQVVLLGGWCAKDVA